MKKPAFACACAFPFGCELKGMKNDEKYTRRCLSSRTSIKWMRWEGERNLGTHTSSSAPSFIYGTVSSSRSERDVPTPLFVFIHLIFCKQRAIAAIAQDFPPVLFTGFRFAHSYATHCSYSSRSLFSTLPSSPARSSTRISCALYIQQHKGWAALHLPIDELHLQNERGFILHCRSPRTLFLYELRLQDDIFLAFDNLAGFISFSTLKAKHMYVNI